MYTVPCAANPPLWANSLFQTIQQITTGQKGSETRKNEWGRWALDHCSRIRRKEGDRLEHPPVFWTTQDEVESKLRQCQEFHKSVVIKFPAPCNCKQSISSKIYLASPLDRPDTRIIFECPARSGHLRAVISNLVRATQF